MISRMVMFELIKTLADADIKFVLVGGLAVALRGYPLPRPHI